MNNIVQSVKDNNCAVIIREQKRSGQTVKEWCAENNITESSFYYHLRKLREMVIMSVQDPAAKEKAIPSGPAFVKIPDTVASSSQGVALRIQKGSTFIEVSNDASERLCSLLKEVLPYVE